MPGSLEPRAPPSCASPGSPVESPEIRCRLAAMTGPSYPYGPPPAGPSQNISIGGPGGIQIQGVQISTSGGAFAPPGYYGVQPYPGAHPSPPVPTGIPAPSSGELQKIADANPKGTALALASAGVAMLVLPLFILPALGFGFGLYVLPAVFSMLPLGGALWMLKRGPRTPPALSPALEQGLLALAVRSGGALTVTETAHQLGMPLEEAEAALMELARKGHVEIDNDSDTGAVIYVFPEIKPAPALRSGNP